MLETERLILRPFMRKDADAVFFLRSNAEMMRFIREPQNREETVNWIKMISSRWKTEKIGFCAVIEKSSNQLIGWCGLWRLKENGEIELGYAIDKNFWHRGLGTEAAERFLQYGFEDLKAEKIAAVATSENTASRRVMEKIGMKYQGIGKFYNKDLAYYLIERHTYFKNKNLW